ncbi:MAG TPA: hypothetical protein VHE55_15075 [Fimbriimonadaceae bacterium]|nr:hypothetical protein [Fimbriimonadaceae bacterium]
MTREVEDVNDALRYRLVLESLMNFDGMTQLALELWKHCYSPAKSQPMSMGKGRRY